MTLCDFEALVLSQQPATHAWSPVTDYSFGARRLAEGQQPQLIADVLCPVGQVLDYGCGPAAHLVRLLTELGLTVIGYDPQIRDSYRYLIGRYDLVICREVLEHLTLRSIRTTIQELCMLSSRLVYVTTRFSSEHDLFRVDTKDDLDPTHITIPSKDLLRLLFVLEGFKRRADLEQAMDWQHKNRCLVYERAV